jgi:hypothetical protein
VPCNILPPADFKTLSFDNKSLPEFPKFSSILELVGHVDALHATDLRTRRSATGLFFCLAGGVMAFKSKLQPTVVALSTENKLIAAVIAAKIAKYLRSILIEVAFLLSVSILRTVVANQPRKLSVHMRICRLRARYLVKLDLREPSTALY